MVSKKKLILLNVYYVLTYPKTNRNVKCFIRVNYISKT